MLEYTTALRLPGGVPGVSVYLCVVVCCCEWVDSKMEVRYTIPQMLCTAYVIQHFMLYTGRVYNMK